MMRTLLAAGRELLGLFIDDGSLVVAVLAWLLLCGLVVPHLLVGPWPAIALFLGIAAILAENAIRNARSSLPPG
jgi:hypothetical protein